MHSWLECVRGIARLPLSCLSPRDAKASHDTAGIRIGVGMGTGYGEGMGGELSRKHPLLALELASSQASHSQIPIRLLQTDGPYCNGDGLANVMTVA